MILYLLKSVACLLILLLVHRLIFQREAIYKFNRFYLLAAVIGSFLIPLVEIEVIGKETETPQVITQEISPIQDFPIESYPDLTQESFSEVVIAEKSMDWNLIFWVVYGLITLVFLIRFVRNINLLFDKINQNVHVQFQGETLVLLKEQSLPFSFLSYIFVSKQYFESNQLTDAIFAHEQAHVHGKHSWDNLLIESLLVVFWFHPGLYLARQAIKLNHEFIADSAALQITPLEQYKTFLLAMMLPDQNPGLVSSLNFSLTKKRFEMMKRKTANSTKWIKILMVLPVLGAIVYFFSEKVTAQAELSSQLLAENMASEIKIDTELNLHIKNNGKIDIAGERIEVEQLAELINEKNIEYTLARISTDSKVEMGIVADVQEVLSRLEIRRVVYEQTETKEEHEDVSYTLVYGLPFQSLTKAEYYSETKFFIKYPNGKTEEFSYDQLSEEYKKGLPNAPGAMKKNVPSSELFESWKNGDEYAIWIDGKVAPNSTLDAMKVSEIAHYFSSYVHSNARSERFPQKNQVNIYTFSGFENFYGSNSSFGKKPIGGTVTFNSENPKNQQLTLYSYPISHYQGYYVQYLERLNFGSTFTEKSKIEQEQLFEIFNDLSDKYLSLSSENKLKVEPPVNPRLSVENQITSASSYQKQATEFLLKISNAGMFTSPSEKEIEELRRQFLALDQTYFDLPMDERRKVSRVSFPFAKIEKDGQLSYKKFELLTDEERKTLGC